jgi:pimeloyl-ACP methyl ester carboxylesterase
MEGKAMTVASESHQVEFDGHRLVYRVSGQGPALVVLNLYRRRADMVHARLLSPRWRVFQVFPLGYGYSERVPGFSGERLVEQVLAVLDRHDVNRFVVWGYSKGGAMGLSIARATTRVAGLVCGGFWPGLVTPGLVRQLDRRLSPDHPSRSLWWWFKDFDWSDELSRMSCARLLYWGGQDRQMAQRLRRTREQLTLQDVDFIEFPGLDHGACGSPEAAESVVVPEVATWLEGRLGADW